MPRVNFSDTLGVENFDEIALSCTANEIKANLCFSIFGKVAKYYYSVSYIAFITKSNPKQAIDLSNAHTKFGKDMSNIFPSSGVDIMKQYTEKFTSKTKKLHVKIKY